MPAAAADAGPGSGGPSSLDAAGAVPAIVRAVATAPARCGATRVVAVDGPSGAGKTTLAGEIAAALGCPTVHMDDLYPGWDGLAAGVRLLVAEVLDPLSRGRSARYRVWDWAAGERGHERTLEPPPVLVIEGCGASVGEASGFAAVRVWVEAPRAVRRARGLERDGEAYRPFWERWAAQEDALFAVDRTRARAHLVVRT